MAGLDSSRSWPRLDADGPRCPTRQLYRAKAWHARPSDEQRRPLRSVALPIVENRISQVFSAHAGGTLARRVLRSRRKGEERHALGLAVDRLPSGSSLRDRRRHRLRRWRGDDPTFVAGRRNGEWLEQLWERWRGDGCRSRG